MTAGRFLVTGGAGFIGSHLCQALLGRNFEVVAVDNFITGRCENLTELLKNRNFEFREQDITEKFALPGGLRGVFHLASPASPVDYAKFPIETLRAGALGSDHILELALAKRCPILVASTSEVYGDPLEHPQKETYLGNVNPIGPRGCYDESKRYLEALTMAFHRSRGLSTRIARIFNTYGPRMRTNDGRVVPNFCMQALRNESVTIYGDGKQTRSFCYVDDLVEGLIRLMDTDHSLPVNLGNPVENTILDFAQKIISVSGSKSRLSFHDLPEDDPRVRRPEITKAKTLFGWEPRVSLDVGLKKTLHYFETQLTLHDRKAV